MAKTSLEQWAILAAIVDAGGFTQAAAVLHKSQSAVSYGVARLQEALEVPLLEAHGRKAVLTAHGTTLLKRARPLLRDLEVPEEPGRTLQRGWEPELRLVGASRAVPLNLVLVRPETAGPAARAAVESFQRHRPYVS